MKETNYAEALRYIAPDLLALAWPCGPWSPLPTLGRKTPLQRAQLAQKREENPVLLRFVRDASLQQRQRGGALLGENPKPPLAWKEPLIEEAFAGMPTYANFNLRHVHVRPATSRWAGSTEKYAIGRDS